MSRILTRWVRKWSQFNIILPFDAFMANFPDGSSALYFERNCGCDEYEKAERVFPIGSDANKLALFELIITGELGTIFGNTCSCGLGRPVQSLRVRVTLGVMPNLRSPPAPVRASI